MFTDLLEKKKKIAVIGLGYVGLPIALEFAKHFSVIGFDINESRVEMMKQGMDKLAAGQKAQRVFLKLLAAFTAQGRRVNHAGGPNYAPKLFADNPESESINKRAFKAAMEGLLAAEKIIIETYGPPSRRTTFIAEAGQ